MLSLAISVAAGVVAAAVPTVVPATTPSVSSLLALRLFLLEASLDNNDFFSGLPSTSTDLRLSSFSAFSAALRSSFSFLATAFSSSVMQSVCCKQMTTNQ